MDPHPDEEEVEYLILDNKREHHWRMVFEGNDGGVDDEKVILHANKWDVYMSEKKALIKGEYYVELSGSDGKKVIW